MPRNYLYFLKNFSVKKIITWEEPMGNRASLTLIEEDSYIRLIWGIRWDVCKHLSTVADPFGPKTNY